MIRAVLEAFCAQNGWPPPQFEYRFHTERKWRFDACFPEKMLAIEVDGGLYSNGRHSRGAGRERDLEKLNEALLLGWRVLVVSTGQVNSGRLFAWLERLMEA